MDDARNIKDLLYEQVARIGKVFSSPKRLELVELLCQGEKTVEILARETSISMKLASAHLRALRESHLVETTRQGKNICYRLADKSVADLWVRIHTLAEDRLTELQRELQKIAVQPDDLVPSDRDSLLKAARKGEVVVLDVRPTEEYLTAHIPFARSIPLGELRQRLDELPRDRSIVAYCRGPYCLMARDAVELLRREGYSARQLRDGVAEWGFTRLFPCA
ncbi:MAG: metalloregulator ArsR/SmtB family transcription factor [Ferrovum sp.]|jgi:rhodanese-related sulfurtransferase|uniref:ArsR/SmtB family transcription factor n=1 Tax=Ferrovum sp. TaxID=2609467 RepID=UPI0026242FAB|nr:metalloregulator ArsR/SmtB family transcription factor [Ferrovum sp.]MBW8072716.1 metalloregulator ArsR/SmtB family transcription factor [Ferrovum sp.]